MTLTSSQHRDLEVKREEMRRKYDTLTKRIAALDTDIGRELDSERKLVLQERRIDLATERDQVLADLTEIEIRLYGTQEAAPTPTKRLHSLLNAGQEADALAAVRELVQNAFDAVREQIAYERLGKSNPSDPAWEERLQANHEINLILHTAHDALWLKCTDDGAGMSRDMIEQHVFVSGIAERPDLQQLALRCNEAGFALDHAGQTGTGVLSYFAAAERIEVRTRRTLLSSENESTGWRFEIGDGGIAGQLEQGPRMAAWDRGWPAPSSRGRPAMDTNGTRGDTRARVQH